MAIEGLPIGAASQATTVAKLQRRHLYARCNGSGAPTGKEARKLMRRLQMSQSFTGARLRRSAMGDMRSEAAAIFLFRKISYAGEGARPALPPAQPGNHPPEQARDRCGNGAVVRRFSRHKRRRRMHRQRHLNRLLVTFVVRDEGQTSLDVVAF